MQLAPYAHEKNYYIECMLPDKMSTIGCTTKENNKFASEGKRERKKIQKKLNCNQEKEELLR